MIDKPPPSSLKRGGSTLGHGLGSGFSGVAFEISNKCRRKRVESMLLAFPRDHHISLCWIEVAAKNGRGTAATTKSEYCSHWGKLIQLVQRRSIQSCCRVCIPWQARMCRRASDLFRRSRHHVPCPKALKHSPQP